MPLAVVERRHFLWGPECVHAYPYLCLVLCLVIDTSTPDCAQVLWWG